MNSSGQGGGVDVARAQAHLHVADGDLQVEAGERRRKARGGVAVDEHNVGPLGLEHGLQHQQHVARHVEQRLSRLYDGQVVVGGHIEHAQHLVEHLAVLAGYSHHSVKLVRAPLKLVDQRTHLDGLRPRAENEHHFTFIHFSKYLSISTQIKDDRVRRDRL